MSDDNKEGAADIQKLIDSAPDHIWLDLGEEAHLVEEGTTFKDLGGVTWSEDNATGFGIKYVRALASHAGAEPARVGRIEVRDGKVKTFAFEQTDIADGEYTLHVATPPAAIPAAPSDALKQWAWHWFGPDADEQWIANALANLPRDALTQPTTVQQAEWQMNREELLDFAQTFGATLEDFSGKVAFEPFELERFVTALKTAPTAAPGDAR